MSCSNNFIKAVAIQYINSLRFKIDKLGLAVNLSDMSHNQEKTIKLFEEKRNLINIKDDIENEMAKEQVNYEKLKAMIPSRFLDENNQNVPKAALFLLKITVMNKKYRKNMIGDLEEEFLVNQIIHGTKSAKFLYWKEVICSIPWNVLWTFISKFIKKMR